MHTYEFHFENYAMAMAFMRYILSAVMTHKFSITGHDTDTLDVWDVVVTFDSFEPLEAIKEMCQILAFYDDIDFGGVKVG